MSCWHSDPCPNLNTFNILKWMCVRAPHNLRLCSKNHFIHAGMKSLPLHCLAWWNRIDLRQKEFRLFYLSQRLKRKIQKENIAGKHAPLPAAGVLVVMLLVQAASVSNKTAAAQVIDTGARVALYPSVGSCGLGWLQKQMLLQLSCSWWF